jgi:hypothetical protein
MVFAVVVILPRLKRKKLYQLKKGEDWDRSILSMANSTKSSGDMFILFKNPATISHQGLWLPKFLLQQKTIQSSLIKAKIC